MAVMKNLTGHTSAETAYVVDDYPYGFKLRCKIRYWIEFRPRMGYRFVSQTTNPKKAFEVWNKPKAGQYCNLGMAMYLDENNHVQHAVIHAHSSNEQIKEFVETFGITEDVKYLITEKIKYCQGVLDGKIYFTTNGIRQDWKESDLEEKRQDLDFWNEMKAKYC